MYQLLPYNYFTRSSDPPPIKSDDPRRIKRIVGNIDPLVGIGSAARVAVSVASGSGVGVSRIVADGVASPNTWVPLFNTVKVWEITTGLFFASTVVTVTVCFP
jgi:hypothetical protein